MREDQEPDRQGLLVVNGSSALGGQQQWNIDQLWFTCRNVLGRQGRSWEPLAPETAPMGNIAVRGRGSVLRGEERASWPQNSFNPLTPTATSRTWFKRENSSEVMFGFPPPPNSSKFDIWDRGVSYGRNKDELIRFLPWPPSQTGECSELV